MTRAYPVTIGVKYCGGCNPYYDRVALVEEMAARLRGKARFVMPGCEGVEAILAVHGCPTACADLSAFAGTRILSVTGRDEGEQVIRAIGSGGLPRVSKKEKGSSSAATNTLSRNCTC
jgi:hypothetical protein